MDAVLARKLHKTVVGAIPNSEISPPAFCYLKWRLQRAEFIASRDRCTESNEHSKAAVVLLRYGKHARASRLKCRLNPTKI